MALTQLINGVAEKIKFTDVESPELLTKLV